MVNQIKVTYSDEDQTFLYIIFLSFYVDQSETAISNKTCVKGIEVNDRFLVHQLAEQLLLD